MQEVLLLIRTEKLQEGLLHESNDDHETHGSEE